MTGQDIKQLDPTLWNQATVEKVADLCRQNGGEYTLLGRGRDCSLTLCEMEGDSSLKATRLIAELKYRCIYRFTRKEDKTWRLETRQAASPFER